MEAEVSMESGCMIRIAVVPVGEVPQRQLREYVSMLVRHREVEMSAMSSFYTEHQKSPFAHQPWESGCLRFKFMVGGSPPSPWEDFQSNRKILALVGVSHCPSSPDLLLLSHQFASLSKSYSSALVHRCFAFSPTDSQLAEGVRTDNLTLFPPADREALDIHLQTMMQDIAATLLMEFEKWVFRAESAGTILKTPLDSQASLSSEEVIKAKKKRLGRAQKTIGDYCLLAGSPVDANAHYSTAIELARLTGDFFWLAGALEGSVCALLMDRVGQLDPRTEEEMKYRYYDVIQLYRKSFVQDNAQRVSTLSFELEAALKLARFLCRQEMAKEVVELLMGAADGAKSLIDANDRLILFVEIARLFGALGYQRKAAFFSRQVAQLYIQQQSHHAAISAMQVLALTSKAYHVESKGTGTKLHEPLDSNSVVQLFESQWSTIQMVVLREILLSSMRAGDALAAWSAAARLLRSYYPLITPAGQSGLTSALASSSERLPPGTRCADPALPFIRLLSFPVHSLQTDIVKRNLSKAEWWTGSAPSGPFIYTPFSKGNENSCNKQDLTWVVGEPVEVLVELANPCGFDLTVDSIYLSVRSNNFDSFPVSVSLSPNSTKVVTLSGIPTSVGSVTIPGCTVHYFGVITEHLFQDVDNLLLGAVQGLVLSDPFRCCGSFKYKNTPVPNIVVVPPLPLLVCHIVGGNGATVMYEGEVRDVLLSLANAGSVPVEQAHASISGKNQDSVVSVDTESLKSALPLKPGAEVTVRITLRACQFSTGEMNSNVGKCSSSNMGRISKEGSNPLMIIHYAGPLDYSGESTLFPVTPGRRLVVPLQVCAVQGLSLVKARLLSMEIPAPVDGMNSANIDFTSENLSESLVKINPYRGSWGLRLLELELFNPTDVVFDIDVSVQMEDSSLEANSFGYPRTRIDRDFSARVLIPLEHFKLPILVGTFFIKNHSVDEKLASETRALFEKNSKAELKASIKNMVTRIKVRWQSGRNSSGELDIKDAIHAAVQASAVDILLPDPLTIGFRITEEVKTENDKESKFTTRSDGGSKGCILVNKMTPMQFLVRNNTKDVIRMTLCVTCRDVRGDNCFEGYKDAVLWAGVLSGIHVEIPPLEEIVHSFSLYFMVPGEYTLLGSAVIDDPNDLLRALAKANSSEDSLCYLGPPFHIRIVEAV